MTLGERCALVECAGALTFRDLRFSVPIPTLIKAFPTRQRA